MRGVEQTSSMLCQGGIKTCWWRCLGCERRLRRRSLFPLSPELRNGSWTSRRGAAGCGSPPRARSLSLSWKTRPRVRRSDGGSSTPLRGEEDGAELLHPGVTCSCFSFPGELFAQAPVEQFPSIAVESVTDSSRYFVIRIEDGNGAAWYTGDGLGESPQKVFSALAALVCEGFLLSRAKYSLHAVAEGWILSLSHASCTLSFTLNKTSLISLLGVSVRTPLHAGPSLWCQPPLWRPCVNLKAGFSKPAHVTNKQKISLVLYLSFQAPSSSWRRQRARGSPSSSAALRFQPLLFLLPQAAELSSELALLTEGMPLTSTWLSKTISSEFVPLPTHSRLGCFGGCPPEAVGQRKLRAGAGKRGVRRWKRRSLCTALVQAALPLSIISQRAPEPGFSVQNRAGSLIPFHFFTCHRREAAPEGLEQRPWRMVGLWGRVGCAAGWWIRAAWALTAPGRNRSLGAARSPLLRQGRSRITSSASKEPLPGWGDDRGQDLSGRALGWWSTCPFLLV